MADYNVQMKQYNGTSFDNIFPHAYLADTATELAGGWSATEIIAQARAGLSQIATGSYVGTGTWGKSHPVVINCGFKPKIVLIYNINAQAESHGTNPAIHGLTMFGWVQDVVNSSLDGMSLSIKWTQTDTGLSWYSNSTDSSGAESQNNTSGKKYYWIALG